MTSHCDPFSRECEGCRAAHARPVAPANADVLARLVALGYEVEVYQYAVGAMGRVFARHIAYRAPESAMWFDLRPMVNMVAHGDGRLTIMHPGVLDELERRSLAYVEELHESLSAPLPCPWRDEDEASSALHIRLASAVDSSTD